MAGATERPLIFFLNRGANRLRLGGLDRDLSLFLGFASRLRGALFGCGLFGAAIFLRAATFLLIGRCPRVLLTPARFLERGEARFLGLAEKLLLKLLAAGNVVLRRRTPGGRCRRLRRWRGRFGDRFRRLDGRGFARPAEDAPLLDLDNDRV